MSKWKGRGTGEGFSLEFRAGVRAEDVKGSHEQTHALQRREAVADAERASPGTKEKTVED